MQKSISKVKVSVIIPTFNRLKYLYPCLISLFNQDTNFFWEIIIVDSGNDNTEEIIKKLKVVYGNYLRYRKIKNSTNRAKLRNIGANTAKGELLIFLDNDIIVNKNFVQTHYEYYNKDTDSVILGKRKLLVELLPEKSIKQIILYHFDKINNLAWINDSRDVLFHINKSDFEKCSNQWRFLHSHNFSISKKKFIELKGFNEVFGNNWGYEDIEFGFRCSITYPNNKFILSNKITGFHIPHINQIPQSLIEGYQNLRIFHFIHNCIEIELNVAFCLEFDYYYDRILNIKNNIKHNHIFDNSTILTLGYIWTKNEQKTFESNKCFGICLPFIMDNSLANIQIINSFFLFPDEIKNSLLSEALRISNDCITIEDSDGLNSNNIIQTVSKNCGYQIDINKEGKCLKISKLKSISSRYICIYLPDCIESKKRFYYEILALTLKNESYFIKLIDLKCKNNVDNENYLLSNDETNILNCFFHKEYGSVKFQSIMSIDNIDSFSKIQIKNAILVDDSPFHECLGLFNKKNNSQTIDFNVLESAVLDFIYKNESLLPQNDKKVKKKNIILVSADDGIIEDNVEEILKMMSTLSDKELIIKIPDYQNLYTKRYDQHNNTSKINQSFSLDLKYREDEFQLYNLINKYGLKEKVKILKGNYSVKEYVELLSSIDIFLDVSKGVIPSPLVYFSFVLKKKIILGSHIKVCKFIKRCCTLVDSEQNELIEKFRLPINIEEQLTYCFTCISSEIRKAILTANNKINTFEEETDDFRLYISKTLSDFWIHTLQS